jgi:hypothetical protein
VDSGGTRALMDSPSGVSMITIITIFV